MTEIEKEEQGKRIEELKSFGEGLPATQLYHLYANPQRYGLDQFQMYWIRPRHYHEIRGENRYPLYRNTWRGGRCANINTKKFRREWLKMLGDSTALESLRDSEEDMIILAVSDLFAKKRKNDLRKLSPPTKIIEMKTSPLCHWKNS